MPEFHKPINWDEYVFTEKFDRDCDAQSRNHSSSSRGSSPYDNLDLLGGDDGSSQTSTESSDHSVSKLEAYLYYHGLRGNRKLGPKLVYRTSKDVFSPPQRPLQDLRKMQLLTVHQHNKLSKDGLWVVIRTRTVELLDRNNIKHTSIDLVRFRWFEEHLDADKEVIGPITIWIGVYPDSTNADMAFASAQDILDLLNEYGINDIEVAFRESVAQPLAGTALYAPVGDLHALKEVIDGLTTALGVPIAGMKTLHMQGTLGFYFKVGEDLYGVTARHVLFPDTEGNDLYRYNNAAPKKKVVLMGSRAFDTLLVQIQSNIVNLRNTALVLTKRVNASQERALNGDQNAQADQAIYQRSLTDTEALVGELKRFYATLKTEWSSIPDRVIGHVVWSPPITGSNPPHGYTCDVCVIKLDNDKFLPNFRGNVIDLGTEIESGKMMSLMYPRIDAPSEFDYPEDRLYPLRSILPSAHITDPNSRDIEGDPTRFVIKRGLGSLTTIGRLNGFESHQRRYGLFGNFDSVEAAVYPYDNDSGPFSRGGDSGAAIAGANNDFIAQLTGGGGADSLDVTYGTPIDWLWNDVIKVEFPDAVLFIDN